MILQALNQYYGRLRDDPDIDISPLGFGRQGVHFVLVLDKGGQLVQVKDIRETTGKKIVPTSLIVPMLGKKRSVGIEPNFMWDNASYVLGVYNKTLLKNDNERTKKANRTKECHEVFKELHRELGKGTQDPGIQAVLKFLDNWDPESAENEKIEHWDEIITGANLVFKLDGERSYIHDRSEVRKIWQEYNKEASPRKTGEEKDGEQETKAVCLISGEVVPIARLHPAIKGVKGAQTSGASLVSFNLDAFLSYGKKQNFNAPIGNEAALAYTTALNYLLSRESHQKILIGDTTTVFWTERTSPIEGFMGVILDPEEDLSDLAEIKLFLEAARDGKQPNNMGDPDINFFILGLSPNASRISVRFWHVSTVGSISDKIGQHFKDLSIVRGGKDPEFPSVGRLLWETVLKRKQEKAKNISPLLAGALMRSILTGTAYPQSLLSTLINRIRADHEINYIRAATIKAYLNRKHRIHQNTKEVSMSLDKGSTSVAYQLGRLFAVLEKAQKEAIPGANTTIKDRYYGSASATPSVVFPQLLRLAQHHLQKAEYGTRTDKMIEEILKGLERFPAHLSLDEQGMFSIGYYHQRHDFYVKSENNNKEA